MTKVQRSQYEMFLQSRDFVTVHRALLPESSVGGEVLAQLADAIAQIERHGSARLKARDAGHDTAPARAALKQWMLDIAFASRDLARKGVAGVAPLTVPDKASDVVLLAAANRFLEAGQSFSAQLVQRGLGEQWADAFKKAIDAFAASREERRAGKRGVTTARTSMASAFKSGFSALHTLDGIVDIALRQQPDLRPAWEQCRRVVAAGSRKAIQPPAEVPAIVEEGELQKAS